ncbi:MAG TPA: PAS domain-containing protein [Bacteroidia bacterium]
MNGNFDTKHETTLDNLMEGFQLIGFDWHYLYVNEAVVKQSKYKSKEELLGFTMMQKFPGIENTELFVVLKKCMKQRSAYNLENEFSFPDGSTGYFELRIQAVPEGIFILSVDITERKRREKERLEHIRKLEEMMFITSHKVRQPIAQILGFSDLLSNPTSSEDEVKRMTGYMKQSALSLEKFTQELTLFMQDLNINVQKESWA